MLQAVGSSFLLSGELIAHGLDPDNVPDFPASLTVPMDQESPPVIESLTCVQEGWFTVGLRALVTYSASSYFVTDDFEATAAVMHPNMTTHIFIAGLVHCVAPGSVTATPPRSSRQPLDNRIIWVVDTGDPGFNIFERLPTYEGLRTR